MRNPAGGVRHPSPDFGFQPFFFPFADDFSVVLKNATLAAILKA